MKNNDLYVFIRCENIIDNLSAKLYVNKNLIH